jgi:cobalt-zinc-cadmium efflux system membrane fusion protein
MSRLDPRENASAMRKALRAILWLLIVGGLSVALYAVDIRAERKTETSYESTSAAVKPGAARPAAIEVDAASQRLVGLDFAPAEARRARRTVGAFCQLQLDLNDQVLVKTFVSGMVEKRIVEQGQHVERGDPLFVMRSNDLAVAKGTYMSAKAQLELSKAVFDRDEQLVGEKIVSQTQYDTDKAAWLTARNAYVNAREQLFIDGLSEADLEKISYENQKDWITAVVTSPIEGEIITLTNAHATGDLVPSGTDLCQVADLTHVWAIGNAYEKDLADLRLGAPVELGFVAYAGATWRGTVDKVADVVNQTTRTLDVRVVLENKAPEDADAAAGVPERFPLKPGLFGNMAISSTHYPEDLVWIPQSTFLPYFYASGEKSLFVALDDTHFAERRVRAVAEEGRDAGVRGDLKPGERVVTTGNVFLARRWEER